jgi:hypothetical protein
MGMLRITKDEEHVLSDGSKAAVSHMGRMYFYTRLYLHPELDFHDEHASFTGKGAKANAMALLEKVIKSDVLETE